MGRCPKCGISNLESEVKCDCGYVLKPGAPPELYDDLGSQASSNSKLKPGTEFRGLNGTIILQETSLVIKRGAKGFILGGYFLRGDKSIPYSCIGAVQLKKAGAVHGYIQFTLIGGPEAKRGSWEALTDENTVTFNSWGNNNEKFSQLKRFVEGKMGFGANQAASPTPASVSSVVGSSSSLDELEKLARLKDKGIVTEEEFQLKKKQLLGL